MNFRGHFLSGVLAGGAFFLANLRYPYFSVLDAGIMWLILIVYALIPDIDTDSYIQTYFYLATFGVAAYLFWKKNYLWSALVGMLVMLPVIAHHRGFVHSLWFGVLVSLPLAFFSPWYTVVAFCGFMIHLIGDL